MSSSELARMSAVYKQSMDQTRAIRELKKHFQEHLESSPISPDIRERETIVRDRRRRKRTTGGGSTIYFHLSPQTETEMVVKSTLKLRVVGKGRISIIQTVAGGNGGITLDSTLLHGEGKEQEVMFKVEHAVQVGVGD